jgi:hypothetical protein
MLTALILSYRRFYGSPALHVLTGVACSFLFVIHFYLNRKAFAAFGKGIKKIKPLVKLKYLIDWLLIIIWGIAVILGFFALFSYMGIINDIFDFKRLQGIFARVGGVLILIHIFQHGRQILSYIKKPGEALTK